MIFCQTIKELKHHLALFSGNSIAFVPTMGALHQGHLALIKHAKSCAQKVVVSIFVNPTQFTNTEDFEKYPQNIEEDIKTLKFSGVDILFAPFASEMYSPQLFPESLLEKDAISLPSLFSQSEGACRPGHFEGVFQVLYRFFSLIHPNVVVFGQKDFQQTLLVKHLIKTSFQKIALEVVPTVRMESGLAFSSRNQRLSENGLKKAKVLYQALQAIKSAFMNHETKSSALISRAESVLKQEPLVQKIENLEIRNPITFKQKTKAETGDVVLLAVLFEGVRLIDVWIL